MKQSTDILTPKNTTLCINGGWTNIFADAEVPYATCVDMNGKRYNIAMDEITPLDTANDFKQ